MLFYSLCFCYIKEVFSNPLPYGPIVFLVDVKVIEAESKERRESKKVNITDPLTFV